MWQLLRSLVAVALAGSMTYLLAPRELGQDSVQRVQRVESWATWRRVEKDGSRTWAWQFLRSAGRGRGGGAVFLLVRTGGADAQVLVGASRLSAADSAAMKPDVTRLSDRRTPGIDLVSGQRLTCDVSAAVQVLAPDARAAGTPAIVMATGSVCGHPLRAIDAVESGIRCHESARDRLP